MPSTRPAGSSSLGDKETSTPGSESKSRAPAPHGQGLQVLSVLPPEEASRARGLSQGTRLSLDTSSARASPPPPSCLPSSARPAQPRGERWQLGTRQQSQKQQRSCLAASQTLACFVISPEPAALLPPEVPTLPSHTCLLHQGLGWPWRSLTSPPFESSCPFLWVTQDSLPTPSLA